MLLGVEATLGELAVIKVGLGRQGDKAHEDLLVAGFFALGQKRLGVVGVLEVLVALIAADMPCDQFLARVDTNALGIGFDRKRVFRHTPRAPSSGWCRA